MTAQDIVNSVDRMRSAAEGAIWYATHHMKFEFHDSEAARYARDAAHEADNLIELAIEITEARA